MTRPRPGVDATRILLLYPLSRQQTVQSLQHLARFTILECLATRDAIAHLPIPLQLKKYLNKSQYFVELDRRARPGEPGVWARLSVIKSHHTVWLSTDFHVFLSDVNSLIKSYTFCIHYCSVASRVAWSSFFPWCAHLYSGYFYLLLRGAIYVQLITLYPFFPLLSWRNIWKTKHLENVVLAYSVLCQRNRMWTKSKHCFWDGMSLGR